MQQQNAVTVSWLKKPKRFWKFNEDEFDDEDKAIEPFLGRGFSTVHRLPARILRRHGKRVPVAFGAFASGDMLVVSAHNKGSVLMMNVAASACSADDENGKSAASIDLAAIREALPVDDTVR